MREENFNEFIYNDINKLSKLISKYKKILEVE